MNRTPDPSVKLLDRLKHVGKTLQLPPGTMLLLYAQQGFLARLDASRHAERFVLKGGLSLFARYEAAARPTQDIDLAARDLPHTPQGVADAVRDILTLPYPDGLSFDPSSVRAQVQNEGLRYPGVGVRFTGVIGRARQPIQLDVSFGNVITPSPVTLTFPCLLLPAAVPVRMYPLETVIAEKSAALAELGLLTTRMKDVYDLDVLARREAFDASTLSEALSRSFAARMTSRADIDFMLSDAFADDAQLAGRWGAYLRRTGLHAPPDFAETIRAVQTFLGPVVTGEAEGQWRPERAAWTSRR